jgi:hypothetical protein
MAYFHERAAAYPPDHEFERDVLLEVKPEHIKRWCCVKVFGIPDPTDDDHPTLGRSSSILFYKKAISHFMPNRLMSWNEVTEMGNPTKSREMNDLIKRVKKEEIRKTGKKSSARRGLAHGEYLSVQEVLRGRNNDKERYLVPCVMNLQYNMIARLDDACELEFEDLKENEQFPFAPLIQMCWSKNVHEERDAPEQILLGAQDWRYCILLSLAVFLEVWIGNGQGMLGTLVFNAGNDDPRQTKNDVSSILRDILQSHEFQRAKPGPLGTHSIRKLGSTHARRSGCSKDDTDSRARWKRKRRQQDDYNDPTLPYPDAKVAGRLCIGGPIKYELRQNSGISEEWIAEHVVPNIVQRLDPHVAAVLGRALLWACFEQELEQWIPPAIKDRVQTAYHAIQQLPDGENPVMKVALVITGNDDELHIDDVLGGIEPQGGGDVNNAARQPQQARGLQEELLALRCQVAGMRRDMELMRSQSQRNQARNEHNFALVNRKLGRIAMQPIQRIVRNANDGEHQNNNNNENDHAPEFMATLAPHPRNLHVLWQEYEYGIGGRKPAKDFTAAERGKVKYGYHRRKVVWDVISLRVRAGDSAQIAVDRIYDIYGGAGSTVSSIINRMRRDRQIYNGCHPDLQP